MTVPMPTPQKQEFSLMGDADSDCYMVCQCGVAFYPNTLDEAVKIADDHEQDKHAIYELDTA